MKIDYLTLFPEMFDGVLNHSILKRAQDKEIIDVNTINFRDYSINKHNQVDDYPFGGAAKIMSGNSETETQEVGFKERFQLASAPKNRIAQAAVKMIHEGMTVILDSGSTTMLIAEGLMTAKNITVITNSLPAAFALSENKDITLVVCGGTVRHKTRSMHGSIAERSLQDINADLMFVGADGIDAVNGITTFNEGYSVSGAMVTAANKVIAVLDSSKFNRRGFNQVLPIEKIDIIITDDAVSEVDKLALQKTRVKLITV